MINIIVYLYILHVIYTIIKSAKNKTLYLWSPVLVIDLTFIEGALIPFMFFKSMVADFKAFQYIVYSGVVTGLLFHFILYKYNFKKVKYYIPKNYILSNSERKKVIIGSVLLIISTGLLTGVLTTFLKGGNIEDLRRTSEVGLGFIRDIPFMILQLSYLAYLFISKTNVRRKFGVSCLISFVCFASIGNKAVILDIMTVFLIYMLVSYRGFKLWQFLLFRLLVPLTAGILNGIRNADLSSIPFHTQNYLFSSVWLFEVNTYPIIKQVELQNSFLNGQEFLSSLTRIIPRFLWEDKPLSYDYYYKELINYDFEGGGTPMPYIFRFYTNFGSWFPLYYLLWFFIIYVVYYVTFKDKLSLPMCLVLLLLLSRYNSPLNVAYYLELIACIAIIFGVISKFKVRF